MGWVAAARLRPEGRRVRGWVRQGPWAGGGRAGIQSQLTGAQLTVGSRTFLKPPSGSSGSGSGSGLRSRCLRDEGSPSGVLRWGRGGRHGAPTAPRQPRPGLPAPYLDSGLRSAGAGSASSPCGRRWGSAGRGAGPAPRPTRGPPGATPHLGRAPPLLADSAGLPGRLRPLPLPVGRLCWGRGRNQPNAGQGVPGPDPQENRTRARRTTSQRPASPLWAGPSVLSTPGTRGRREGSCGEGRGSENEGISSHPLTDHLTPLTRLCTLDFSASGAFPAAFSASFRSVRVTPCTRSGQSGWGGQPLQDGVQAPGPSSLRPGSVPSHTCVDLRDWRMRRERAFR